MTTQVKQVMAEAAERILPQDTIQKAALRMREANVGFLVVHQPPAGVVGVLTDRDIAVRVAAEGRDPTKTEVKEAMTQRLVTCHEEDELGDAARVMRRAGVRRLIVLDSQRRIVGVLSVDDLIGLEALAGEVVQGTSHHAP